MVTRRAWVVGFGFGLIHGFGFAGALGELGLPTTTRLLALLGFNAGVELGQLVVVCAVLPGLFLLRRALVCRHGHASALTGNLCSGGDMALAAPARLSVGSAMEIDACEPLFLSAAKSR